MTSGRHAGFTYLSALIAVAVMGVGLASVGEAWSRKNQREREAELLWIGEQFRMAIGLYYQRTPGAVKRFPEKMEDLLEDKRFLSTQRYLRRVYADPMTGKPQWVLVPAPGGGFMGVRSLSEKPALSLRGKSRNYAEWTFIYEPPVAGAVVK